MASLKLTILSTFGLFPKTDAVEARKKALDEQYARFCEFEKSDDLADYLALEKNILSVEFAENKKRIQNLNFKNTEQFKLLNEFNQLSKANDIICYLKVKSSTELEFINTFIKSDKKKRYDELINYFASNEHKSFLASLYEQKNKLQNLNKEFLQLKNSNSIKLFFKVKNSKELSSYLKTKESDKLKRLEELKLFVESQKLTDLKNALVEQKNLLEGKKKRFHDLQKNADLKIYFQILKSNELKNHEEIESSGKHDIYSKLEQIISSTDYKTAKSTIKKAEWLNHEYYKTEQEYLSLKNSKEFKLYLKFRNNQKLAIYYKIAKSPILEEYKQLKEEVTSPDFAKDLAATEFKNSQEFKQEQEYGQLKKDAEINHYFRFENSKEFKHFIDYGKSNELERFTELEQFIQSPEYTKQSIECEYKNTEICKNETELNQLKKDTEILRFAKFVQSREYNFYLKTIDSDILNRYNELKKTTTSEEFNTFKSYMLDPKKWEKSEEYAKEQEYFKLKKSEKILWYYKLKKTNPFKELTSWTLTFNDEFENNVLNKDKWMTSYYWGKMLLKDSYVLENDKHFLTEGKNLEFTNSSLRIITKKEKVTGKLWNPKFGFMPKEFDYTSGIINTAHSFRQLYGKFEAKIKFNHSFPVYQAFWLKGEKITPEIDIAKYHHKNPKTLFIASHLNNGNKVINKTIKTGGLNFNDNAYIFSLLWTPGELCWQINGVTVHRQNSYTPEEPLYLVFNAGITNQANQAQLPAAMEIDWVRVYTKTEN